MAIAFGIFAIMLGSFSALAAVEPKPNQAAAVISGLLCVAFLAASVALGLH